MARYGFTSDISLFLYPKVQIVKYILFLYQNFEPIGTCSLYGLSLDYFVIINCYTGREDA